VFLTNEQQQQQQQLCVRSNSEEIKSCDELLSEDSCGKKLLKVGDKKCIWEGDKCVGKDIECKDLIDVGVGSCFMLSSLVSGGCVELANGSCISSYESCENYPVRDCNGLSSKEGICFVNGDEGCQHIFNTDDCSDIKVLLLLLFILYYLILLFSKENSEVLPNQFSCDNAFELFGINSDCVYDDGKKECIIRYLFIYL
jgi:hypothetical protein